MFKSLIQTIIVVGGGDFGKKVQADCNGRGRGGKKEQRM